MVERKMFVKKGRFEFDSCDACMVEGRSHLNEAEWKTSCKCKSVGNRRLQKPRVLYICEDHYRAGVSI